MLHATTHWKTIHFYLHYEFQVHQTIIAFVVACLKQLKAILSSSSV
jgi:hypothetical protein